MKKRAKRLLSFALAIPLILCFLLLSGITIPLDFLDQRLETLAAQLLDRNVSIDGPIRLRTSLQPSLELGGLTIGNPRDWPEGSGHLLLVKKSRAQISLLDLLSGKFNISDLAFSGVDLQLVARADGTVNYQFFSQSSTQDKSNSRHELSSLEHLVLQDIELSYVDEFSGKRYTLEIDEAHGQGKAARPIQFSFSGKLGETPCSLNITGGSLTDLLAGKESWPLTKGRLTLADLSLNLTGAFNLANKGQGGYLNLALEGQSLDLIGRNFNLLLPDIGDFTLKTEVSVLPGAVQFTNIRFFALQNNLAGDLVLSLDGDRPSLGGTLTAATLTLGGMSQANEETDSTGPETAAPVQLPWNILNMMDADLQVRFSSVDLGGVQLNNFQGVISLFDGDLVMPVSMSVMDLTIYGHFEIATSTPIPAIIANVTSPGGALDPIFEQFAKDRKRHARLGELSLKSRSRGSTLAELLQGVDLELSLGPTLVQKDSMVVIASQRLSLEKKHQQSFSLSAAGEFLGSPFNLETAFDRSKNTSQYAGPSVQLQLTACDTELMFEGGKVKSETGESAFTLMIDGEKLCGFLQPVEHFLGKNTNYALKTSGSLKSGELRVDVETARLGNLAVYGQLALISDDDSTPVVSGVINSRNIDLTDILQRTDTEQGEPEPEASPASAQKDFEQKKELFMNVLAMEIEPIRKYLATDVRLRVNVEELITGVVSVSDIKLAIETKNGKLKHSPFQARIGGSFFTGNAAIDATARVPSAHLSLTTNDFSLPELIKDFDLGQAPDVSAEHVGLDLSFTGKTIQEMLQQATYQAELRRGRIVLPREPQIPLVINLEELNCVASPGQPVMMSLAGDINSLPLSVKMVGDGVFAKGSDKPVTLSVQAGLADIRLDIDGQVNRIKGLDETFRLSTILSGNRMDDLNQLLGINMPPLGPYQIGGALASGSKNSIGLYDMGLQIGDSTLKGEAILSTTPAGDRESGVKANLQTRLKAESIQLNDFQFGNWSPVTGNGQESQNGNLEENIQELGKTRLYNIFSEDIAEDFNGTLEVLVQEVLSGSDNLGKGRFAARLEDGRYNLDDLQLDIPGGTIRIEGTLLPEHDRIGAELKMEVKQFDYGILARRTKPDSNLKGEVNLILDLNAQAETPAQFKQHMSGRLRFGVIPEEFKAGMIDLWAVNIIVAALPALMKGSSSVVNCLAGDLLVADGIMHPEVFILDTTKMRVQGRGTVDFKTNEIDFYLKPTPKSAQFFSMATPISVSGSIFKPDIGVTTAGVVGTLFRQVTGVVTVPLKWLFSDTMEADGTHLCSDVMQWAQELETAK